jgi:sugar phosphate isomerase/epimerase
MNLALSNLAWGFDETDSILNKLKYKGIYGIEGVFSKIGKWDSISDETIKQFKKVLDGIGMECNSIQSIFYNVECNDIHNKDTVISHIKLLIRYCEILGVEVMVFGSPKLRMGVVDDVICDIFHTIDTMLLNTNIEFIIEPNSKVYGGNYFYTLDEIVNFIEKNEFNKIKTMIDTHNLKLEGYNPSTEFIKYKEYIHHIHISEVGLTPIKSDDLHIEFSNTLRNHNYNKIITYEVSMLEDFDTNIDTFIKLYNIK